MKCQNCGNELGQDEVFCGQCGTPNAVPVQPTEMMQQAPASQLGLSGGSYRSGTPGQFGQPSASENMPLAQSATPPQMSGFYQDATESISSLSNPNSQMNYPPGSYPQQGYQGRWCYPAKISNKRTQVMSA